MLGRDAHAESEQRGGTVAGVGTDVGQRFFRLPQRAQQAVERRTQVGRGIGQRAVEIEQYGADIHGRLLANGFSGCLAGGRQPENTGGGAIAPARF